MTIDDQTMMQQLLRHVQAMAYQSKQVAMDGGNWRKLLEDLAAAEKLMVPINNALRKAGTEVYLVSSSPLPDDMVAYDNEEGASDDAWDRKTLGGDATVTALSVCAAPTARLTTGR